MNAGRRRRCCGPYDVSGHRPTGPRGHHPRGCGQPSGTGATAPRGRSVHAMGADPGAPYFRGTEHVSSVSSTSPRQERSHHVSRSLPDRSLRRSPPVARPRSLGARRGDCVHAQLVASAVSPTRASASPAPSRSVRPTPSRHGSRRRRSTPPTSIFHAEDGLTPPARQGRCRAGRGQLAEGKHVIDVGDPYDPRGPTVSKDGTTAFATVAFDTEEIGPEDFAAREGRRRSLRDAASRSSTTRASATPTATLRPAASSSASWSPSSCWPSRSARSSR